MTQAQAPAEERVVSSFPDPPSSLYKVYTDENVRSGLVPKPPAPIKGKYHMFGCLFDVSFSTALYLLLTTLFSFCTQTEDAMIRPLEEQGLERLYPADYGLSCTIWCRYTVCSLPPVVQIGKQS